jgi:DNA (cytosine-5)-methyltransferase 1
MGFDAPGRSDWVIDVSDTRAYKQFGNAVVVPVVAEVARLMRPYLLGEPSRGEQLELLPRRSAA